MSCWVPQKVDINLQILTWESQSRKRWRPAHLTTTPFDPEFLENIPLLPVGEGLTSSQAAVPDRTSSPSRSVCLTLWDPMGCNPPGSSVPGILQARLLEWVVNSFSRVSSWPRDQIWVSRTIGKFFTNWATREASRWGLSIGQSHLLTGHGSIQMWL